MRAAISDQKDKLPLSMYWIIERTSDASKVNLGQQMVSASLNMTLHTPEALTSKEFCMPTSAMPQIPILYNVSDIPAKTQLCAPVDANLDAVVKAALAKEVADKKIKEEEIKKQKELDKKKEEDNAEGKKRKGEVGVKHEPTEKSEE